MHLPTRQRRHLVTESSWRDELPKRGFAFDRALLGLNVRTAELVRLPHRGEGQLVLNVGGAARPLRVPLKAADMRTIESESQLTPGIIAIRPGFVASVELLPSVEVGAIRLQHSTGARVELAITPGQAEQLIYGPTSQLQGFAVNGATHRGVVDQKEAEVSVYGGMCLGLEVVNVVRGSAPERSWLGEEAPHLTELALALTPVRPETFVPAPLSPVLG